MFTDEGRYRVSEAIGQCDLRAFQKLLSADVLDEAARRGGLSVVRCVLCGPHLIWLAVSAALHRSLSFAQVLTHTIRILDLSADGLPPEAAAARRRAERQQSGRQPQRSSRSKTAKRSAKTVKRSAKKEKKAKKATTTPRSRHDPHGQNPLTVTEEAFVKARKLMPPAWWTWLIIVLGERFENEHRRLVRWKGFRVLALDGTTLTLPKKKPLTEYFGTSGNGKARTTQARMVMLQLPFVRLPWRYELGPITEGERTVAGRLLHDVRRNDLVLMDMGFWSYGLFCQLRSAKAFFGIRLPSGVKLGRTLKRLGRKDRLVAWTMPTGPRWRGLGLPEALTLRVIDYQIRGFRPSAVVTTVLDPQRLSRDDWVHVTTSSEAGRALDRRVRLRQGLYHRRWEIETTFHELKVIQQMEASLRGRTPESIRYEIAGHVVLYLLIRWLMVEAAQAAAPDGDPLGLSFKHAFEAVSESWNILITAQPHEVEGIVNRLLQQIASHQIRWRPGRHDPRPNDTKTKNLGNGHYKQPHKKPTHKSAKAKKQS
jgi:hypothetical protein